jgi:tRNA (uracil-5-)-methyltransferase TRM9
MNKDYANYLLKKTKDDYNRIADKFSSTRSYLPADILALKKYANSGDKILDLGCGNGRLSELFKKEDNCNYFGTDFSKELIAIARKKYKNEKFYLANALKLPFLSDQFDMVYCLSVFHHIPSSEYRIIFLKEIMRVLKPNGKVVLTVWNLKGKKNVNVKIVKNSLLGFFGLSKLDKGDIFLSFKTEGKTVERYIHCFTPEELEKIFAKAGFKICEIGILKRGKKVENENILIVGQK